LSAAPTIEEIAPEQREALAALVRGDALDDIAERSGRPADEVLDLAHQGMAALAGDAVPGLSPQALASIGNYVLDRQSPGQAEGTWRLLESSSEAEQWAVRLRDALAAAGHESPPPLPGEDGALSPTQRAQQRAARRDDGERTLGEQRQERSRRRTAANAMQAAAELESPFRSEAVEAFQEADDRIELPSWAPWPAQLALYAVLVALIIGLGFAIFVRIPVNTNAVVLITDLPADSPGARDGGLQVIALFAQANGRSKDTGSGKDIEVGDVLRVALPGRENRSPMRLRWVSDGPQAPRAIVDSYRLPLGQANRVTAPAYVALAALDAPPGKAPRSFEGTTTTEASVETGSRRIISLLF